MSDVFPRLDPHLVLSQKIEAPTVLRAVESIKQELQSRLSQIGLGKHVQAEVIAKLSDGSFVAKIADLPVHVQLPAQTQVGQKIQLSLNQVSPHLSFTLLDSSNTPTAYIVRAEINKNHPQFHDFIRQTQVEPTFNKNVQDPQFASTAATTHVATHSAQQANKTAPSAIAGIIEQANVKSIPSTAPIIGNDEPELSDAAKLIAHVLKLLAPSTNSAKIQLPTPLIPHHAFQASTGLSSLSTQIAQKLQQQLKESGLFYESHLVDWFAGKRTLEEIKREPQAQLLSAWHASSSQAENPIPRPDADRIAHILSQQLALLEHPKLCCHAQLDTHTTLVWEVGQTDEQSASNTTNEEHETKWLSSLKLDLPHLGKLQVMLALRGHELDIQLFSQASDTPEIVNAQLPELRRILANTGTQLCSFHSHYDESL